MKKKVFQLNSELYKITGIQRVITDIHKALKNDFDAKIVGNISFDKVHPNLQISPEDYLQLKNPFKFRNSIIIIHERKFLPLIWCLTHFPGLNIKAVYVHHNELYGKRHLSLFPKNIVAISDAGIENLTKYFGVNKENITKIHNCVREEKRNNPTLQLPPSRSIKIVYPARINQVKQQIELFDHLNNKLNPNVQIFFAGVGPQYEELSALCKESKQFYALGFIEDIPSLLKEADFMMLFSKHEGLPISLIEATQAGKPIICNDVGGNTEIVKDGFNGLIASSWHKLLDTLNSLPEKSQEEINQMSKNGREIYERNFTFEKFKAKYVNLIKSLK